MGLDSIVRSGIKIADNLTKTLQSTVTLKQWTGQLQNGDPTYAAPVVYQAIVEQKRQNMRTDSGELVKISATVLFIQPVPPHGAPNRAEPVDPRDVIVLQDGTTGPIVNTSGFVDRDTGRPFYHEVWLG